MLRSGLDPASGTFELRRRRHVSVCRPADGGGERGRSDAESPAPGRQMGPAFRALASRAAARRR